MDPFIYVAVSILTVVLTFLSFRLTGLGSYSWIIASTLIALILLYPLVWYGRLPEKIDSILRTIIHFDMALVSILIGLLLVRDGLFLPLKFFVPKLSQFAFGTLGTGILTIVALILLVYGYWNAARGPKVVEVAIPVSKLPDTLKSFSVVQISDLHAGAGIGHTYVQNAVNIAQSLDPDVVVLTGDIGDGDFERYGKNVDPLRQLIEHKPVFYITGNHEYIKDSAKWIESFKDMGMKMLFNQNEVLDFHKCKILFAGIVDPEAAEVDAKDGPDLEKASKNEDLVDLKILLAHQPKFALEAASNFHLQISGHTHGGQFFPWNIVINFIQKFPRGLSKHKSMWIYVNQGTGYWGPPVRIGTRSEITRFRFVNSEKNDLEI